MSGTIAASDSLRLRLFNHDEYQRLKTIIPLLIVPLARTAINAGVRLDYDKLGLCAEIATEKESPPCTTQISLSIMSDAIIDPLLNSAAVESLAALTQYIDALSISDLSQTGDEKYATVVAKLNKDSQIKFDDKTFISLSDIQGEVIQLKILPVGGGLPTKDNTSKHINKSVDSRKLVAVWEDTNGTRIQKTVTDIKNVSFSMKSNLVKKADEEEGFL